MRLAWLNDYMKLYSHFQDRVLFIIREKSKPELFCNKRGSLLICFSAPMRNYGHFPSKKSTVQEAPGKKRQSERMRVSVYDSHQDKIKPPPHSSLRPSGGSLIISASGATTLTKNIYVWKSKWTLLTCKQKQKFTVSII